MVLRAIIVHRARFPVIVTEEQRMRLFRAVKRLIGRRYDLRHLLPGQHVRKVLGQGMVLQILPAETTCFSGKWMMNVVIGQRRRRLERQKKRNQANADE